MSEAYETYVITFHVRPDQLQRFRALLDPVLDAMRHETTFVYAALHIDPDRPNQFQLHETWSNREDVLQVQLHRPYRANWHAALDELLEHPRKIEIWQQLWSASAEADA
ncbi:antibiotic biosynthesis monooxygenase [Altererythrobacter xixiisoli]|uniref:Antibiotic biosynthesis monooxygenase n=1 Tax=Croceibacterium xixiisoli TaxID=1476466 RepID=A0A6I4TT47_9SPHN|nr:putative quinol monooxygenase [Croceibacterium xixiisoli]MXO98047.1 antibiotic biosynthesis monooxygenase [Croceibacterium xixiisoli]